MTRKSDEEIQNRIDAYNILIAHATLTYEWASVAILKDKVWLLEWVLGKREFNVPD